MTVKELKTNNMPDPKIKKSTVSAHGGLNDAQKEYETDLELMDLRNKDKNVDLDKGDNMPVRRSGFGPRTSFGGSKNPELVKSPAGYAPFKMMGHELPGIKQRSPGKLKSFGTKHSENPEKISKKSGILYKGGTGESPAKGIFDFFKKKTPKGVAVANDEDAKNTKMGNLMEAITGGGGGSTVAPHGDEAHTGGGGGGSLGGGAMGQAVAGGAGGAGGGSIFNVGDAIAGLEGLDRQGQDEYMKQFDNEQRSRIRSRQMRQSHANMTGKSFFGVEPNKPKSSFGFM